MFHVKHFEVKGSWVQRFEGSSLYPRAAHSAHLSHFRTFSTLSAYSKNLRILSNLSVGLAVILAGEEPQPLQNPQNPFPMEPKNLKPQTQNLLSQSTRCQIFLCKRFLPCYNTNHIHTRVQSRASSVAVFARLFL